VSLFTFCAAPVSVTNPLPFEEFAVRQHTRALFLAIADYVTAPLRRRDYLKIV